MQKTRDLTLTEVFLSILKKWKLIVILAVVLALVLGLYRFVTLYGTEIDSSSGKPEITYDEYRLSLQSYRQNIEQGKAILKAIEQHNQNSYLMTLDPCNCASASTTCMVRSNASAASAIANALAKFVENIDYTAANIAAGTALEGIDNSYLAELVTIDIPLSLLPSDIAHFTVMVVAENADLATALCNNLVSFIGSSSANAFPDYSGFAAGEFSHTQIQCSTDYNSVVFKAQADLLNQSKDSLARIQEATTAISNLQKKYGSYYTDDYSETVEVEKYSAFAALRSSVKYILVGLVGGAVIGIIIAFLQKLANPTLFRSYQLQDEAGLKFFGNIEDTESLTKMEKAAKKIAGDKAFLSPPAERIAYTAAKLAASVKENTVLVTGTVNGDEINNAIRLLKQAEPTLNFVFKGNLASSSAAIKELEQASGILLMEKNEITDLKSLSALLDACKSTEKNILGYVMI